MAGLLWSLRFRNRDGGYYWHSEPGLGGNLYKAFYLPAPLGEPYDEEKTAERRSRKRRFAIRNLPAPEVPTPASPTLLPIADAGAISWQGSVSAENYQVERAEEVTSNLNRPSLGDGAHAIGGNWKIVSTNVGEAFTQYRPQFADEQAPAGRWYYRVRAKNKSGVSEPSNVVGSVEVTSATLVDELTDFTKTHSHAGDWQIANRDCRSAKEDAHRAAGVAGDWCRVNYPRPSKADVYSRYFRGRGAIQSFPFPMMEIISTNFPSAKKVTFMVRANTATGNQSCFTRKKFAAENF